MSFFMKLFNENLDQVDILESIENQIKMILSNRTDLLLSYYDVSKEAFQLEDFFSNTYLSDDFLKGLGNSIMVNDPRVYNMKCYLVFKNNVPKISMDFKIRSKESISKNFNVELGVF